MPEGLVRALVAVGVAAVGAVLLANAPARLPRDLALTVYAALVAVLGVYAVFGADAAALAGVVVGGTFVVGAGVYGLVALMARWAERE